MVGGLCFVYTIYELTLKLNNLVFKNCRLSSFCEDFEASISSY